MRVTYRKFVTLPEGLQALRAHKLDAFVHDKPLSAWGIQQGFSSSIVLVDANILNHKNMRS